MITLTPIAHIQNNRPQVADDHWGEVLSTITLVSEIAANTLDGIEAFSHLEIIFYMHQVPAHKATATVRHPRNNPDLPLLGTFAQRNKSRPNKIGLTTVELVARKDNTLTVKGLDAISGTPVLDIKPVMQEFEPKGELRQPDWTKVIMAQYW